MYEIMAGLLDFEKGRKKSTNAKKAMEGQNDS